MRIVAIINQKGGVGKTTTAVNLGAALARAGRRVLLVDVDPQANLSVHLDVDVTGEIASIYDLLCGRRRAHELVCSTAQERLAILPATLDLAGAELELASAVGREVILREALERDRAEGLLDYDWLLVDSPPSLGLLAVNALTAADEVVIPIQAQYFALQGMSKLVEVIDLVRARLNRKLQIAGIVVCMYQGQTTLGREVLAEVRRFFGDKVFKTLVRQNVKLAEAPSHGRTIFDYAPASHGAEDYARLCDEVLERWESGPHAERGIIARQAPAPAGEQDAALT
ncbi:MAG: AAA family ATPase [Planctomycetota bacterium]